VLHISLHGGIIELSSDQTLGIEDGVRGVDGNLGKEQKDTLTNGKFKFSHCYLKICHIVLCSTSIRMVS
jgi:hypothetical protein